MTTRLYSSNATTGRVTVLVETTMKQRSETFTTVMRYDDTSCDYGDTFTIPERETLAAGQIVTRDNQMQTCRIVCMISAARLVLAK